MFKPRTALVISAGVFLTATAPAFAQDTLTLKSLVVADIGRSVIAIADVKRTDAKMTRSAPADLPDFERIAKIGGTAQILIDLDAKGQLTKVAVLKSSGRAGIDQSAIQAVRDSTFKAGSVNGQPVGGRYVVEAALYPDL